MTEELRGSSYDTHDRRREVHCSGCGRRIDFMGGLASPPPCPWCGYDSRRNTGVVGAVATARRKHK